MDANEPQAVPPPPDPIAAVESEITTLKEQVASLQAELAAKVATRPIPVLHTLDGVALSEDASICSTQLSSLVNQEIARLQNLSRLAQIGRQLTINDVLAGPLHP